VYNTEPYLGRNPESVSITNSEIQTFKECRRKWWLGTYRALKPKSKTYVGPLTLGIRIHNALEAFYTTGVNPVDEYERLQRVDNALFKESKDALIDEKVKKFNSEAELGRIMLEGYMDWLAEENPDSDIEVIGAETKLSTRLEMDPRVELMGKTDLKVRRASSGFHALMDHKSAQSFNSYYETSHMSEQLMLYVMLEKLDTVNGDPKVDGGIYNLLKKVKRSGTAKPPFYERLDVRFNDKQLQSFWIRTMGTVRDIMELRDRLDAGADPRFYAYPSPNKDCTWKCPFFQVCSMFDDGSSAEAMLEDFYEQVDPNERYEEENET
jgi:CRISPR/Cas system-associated exonuclease Cas4 (RecB family)